MEIKTIVTFTLQEVEEILRNVNGLTEDSQIRIVTEEEEVLKPTCSANWRNRLLAEASKGGGISDADKANRMIEFIERHFIA